MDNLKYNVGDKVLLTDAEMNLINVPAIIERVGVNDEYPYLVSWNITSTSSTSAWYAENDLKNI